MDPPPLFDTNILSELLKRGVVEAHPHFYSTVTSLIAEHGVCVSSVSVYELKRWFRRLELQGAGQHKRVRGLKLLLDAAVFFVDVGATWNVAADLWARAQLAKPAVIFQEADLLIYATAVANGRQLITCDAKLGERLRSVEVNPQVEVLALD